jgi:peptidoglycan/xylan/chitin deacetylase (PgdA/CDA1 family)
MIKSVFKTGMAAALHWSGADLAIWSARRLRSMPLILAYHAVVEDIRPHIGRALLPNLTGTTMLERQVEWVARRFDVVSLDELGRRLETGEERGRPAAAVTFDDGYVGVYEQAFPLLQRKGIPAAAFVVTETVGRPQLQLYDKLYLLLQQALPVLRYSPERLRALLEARDVEPGPLGRGPLGDAFALMRRLFTTLPQHKLRRAIEALETVAVVRDGDYPDLRSLSWEMVETMAAAGWTIGSHTQTHPLLTEESPRRVANQAVGSLKTLQDKLGRPIHHFAYPDGRHNPAVVAAVAQAGYRYGYGTCLYRDPQHPLLTIPRKLMWERTSLNAAGAFSPSVMSCHARRVFDLWAPCGHDHRDPGTSAVQPEVVPPTGSSAVADKLHA